MVGGYALRYALDHPRRWTCDGYRPQEAWPLAPQAGRGSASRLRGLLRCRGSTLGSGRSGLLRPSVTYSITATTFATISAPTIPIDRPRTSIWSAASTRRLRQAITSNHTAT